MKRNTFYFNSDKCVGCKACVIACKDKNNLKPGRKFRRVFTCAGGSWDKVQHNHTQNNVFAYSFSVSCNHCEKPACMEKCPANAIVKREDGIVYINQQSCIGCKACVTACPYGVPSFDPDTNKTNKCDFCRELAETGVKPACVAACLMRALDCGEYKDLLEDHPEDDVTVTPLPKDSQTQPSLIVTPHRGLKSGSTVTVISMPEETYASYGHDK